MEHLGKLAAQGLFCRAECAVAVAGDDAVPPGGFYVGVEGAAVCHVGEGRYLGVEQRPSDCIHDNLGELAPRDVVAGAECAVGVAVDHAVEGGSFYVGVVPFAGLNIREGGYGGGIEGPACAEHYHLHDLGAGGGVEGAECAIGVACDDVAAVQPVHSLVEVLAGIDIIKVDAWQGSSCVGRRCCARLC